jgi:hypothetical protein
VGEQCGDPRLRVELRVGDGQLVQDEAGVEVRDEVEVAARVGGAGQPQPGGDPGAAGGRRLAQLRPAGRLDEDRVAGEREGAVRGRGRDAGLGACVEGRDRSKFIAW